jgi:hypothetical protein
VTAKSLQQSLVLDTKIPAAGIKKMELVKERF